VRREGDWEDFQIIGIPANVQIGDLVSQVPALGWSGKWRGQKFGDFIPLSKVPSPLSWGKLAIAIVILSVNAKAVRLQLDREVTESTRLGNLARIH